VRVDNSFIGVSGVGEKTERGLWEAGVTHWDDFHPEPVGPKTGERIEAFIDEGRSHLDDENVAFFDERFPSGGPGVSTRRSPTRRVSSTSRPPASNPSGVTSPR